MLLRRASACLAVAALVSTVGCGTGTTGSVRDTAQPQAASSPAPSADVPEVIPWDKTGHAPPVTLDLDGERVRLNPWTFCYGTMCADGWDPGPYFDVGQREAVAFSFPDRGWEFEATFKECGKDRCARRITMPVRKTSAQTWVVEPIGPAGRWDVTLFGRGVGDVVTTFSWTTTVDGRLPGAATGSAAVLADNDGLDSYGVEIYVRDLAGHPEDATAEVTVTSADQKSVTIPTDLERPCYDEGTLWFKAPEVEGRRATQLGDGPFTYTVRLVLDGTTYTGVGEWPTGETEEIAPHVPLTWTPELPAYRGTQN
jgi:hypothetical protein